MSAQSPSLHPEQGRIPLTNFSPREYGHQPQNWALAQDASGRIFVGNTEGVLVYDGSVWDMIPTDRRTAVRSMHVGADGLVYVGGQAEFGRLQPRPDGGFAYESLSDTLPEAVRAFADVWWTWALGDDVYFQTQTHLFRYRGGQVEYWPSPLDGAPLRSFLVGGRLLLNHSGAGLVEFDRSQYRPFPDASALQGKRLTFATALDDGRSLFITDRAGWFTHDGKRFTRLQPRSADVLESLPL